MSKPWFWPVYTFLMMRQFRSFRVIFLATLFVWRFGTFSFWFVWFVRTWPGRTRRFGRRCSAGVWRGAGVGGRSFWWFWSRRLWSLPLRCFGGRPFWRLFGYLFIISLWSSCSSVFNRFWSSFSRCLVRFRYSYFTLRFTGFFFLFVNLIPVFRPWFFFLSLACSTACCSGTWHRVLIISENKYVSCEC